MRAVLLLSVLAVGCVDELEVSALADCELLAPQAVAVGERFDVEVACAEYTPSWFDYDFGDGTGLVRTSATVREHVYGDDASNHLWFRVRVTYVDASGETQRLEAHVERRFE